MSKDISNGDPKQMRDPRNKKKSPFTCQTGHVGDVTSWDSTRHQSLRTANRIWVDTIFLAFCWRLPWQSQRYRGGHCASQF